MSRKRLGNFFEDFHIGMRLRHATPRTLTEGDRSLYIGLTGSRSVLSTAQTNAEIAGLERYPLEDLLVFNTAFGKTVPDISLNAVANLGYADVRFLQPVYSGDTISVDSEIIGLRENSSGKSGIVYVRSTARNQAGAAVLSWVRWVMVHKRNPDAPSVTAKIPELVPMVGPSELVATQYGAGVAAIRSVTGVPDLWDDYTVGEWIDHLSGMTVNDSDHSIATRLYQNNAKAHFDAHMMVTSPGGKRLVYGGHVISICKALSYDGLENVLSIMAINGGRHVSPTYAGDTIVCATQVIDKYELSSPHVGALRLRLVAAKNTSDATSIRLPNGEGSDAKYPPNVVLDLDYTVAIPKKIY